MISHGLFIDSIMYILYVHNNNDSTNSISTVKVMSYSPLSCSHFLFLT